MTYSVQNNPVGFHFPNPDYCPVDLVFAPFPFYPSTPEPYTKALISKKCLPALIALFHDAWADGCQLYGISAYRSYYRQLEIYNHSIISKGLEHTLKYIAEPGTSEHQTGLAIDISCPSIDYELIEEFAYTKEGIWIRKHSCDYGFRLTYGNPAEPQKNHGPYIGYEPWHICFYNFSGSNIIHDQNRILHLNH